MPTKPNLVLFMVTAPRQGTYQICYDTLISLAKSGFNQHPYPFHVFDTGQASDLFVSKVQHIIPSAEVYLSDKPINCFENHVRAMETCLPLGDWILLLQDDLLFCKNFINVIVNCIEKNPIDAGCITYFIPFSKSRVPKHHNHFIMFPPRYFYGALCMLFKKQCLEQYLHSAVRLQNEKVNPHPEKFIDRSLSYFFEHYTSYRLYAYLPAIIQHTAGDHSALDHWGKRDAPLFVGEDCDPLNFN